MKTSVFLASVGAGVGALGGGGALAYHLLQKETITVKDTLTKKGHTFLDFELGRDLGTWKGIGKAYANSEKHRISGLNINKPAGATEITDQEAKALQKECQKLINNKDYKEKDILSAEQWCVKPVTIKELISKHKKVLTLEQDKAEEQAAWNKKVNDYLTTGAKNKLPQTTLTGKGTAEGDRKKLRDECNKLIDKKTHDVDFHENYASFNEWCTLPKVNG